MTKSLGSRILKVNHAGENGAVCIYAGQILVFRATAPDLLASSERSNRMRKGTGGYFGKEIGGPTYSALSKLPSLRCRGYILRLITPLFGRGSIAATTFAVERVVLRHLDHQLVSLRGTDSGAVAAIEAIISDERDHHEVSAAKVAAGGFWLKLPLPHRAFSRGCDMDWYAPVNQIFLSMLLKKSTKPCRHSYDVHL